MTTTVVEQSASGSEPVRPILLMLNCSNSVPLYGENNPDLFDLYGVRVLRIAIEIPNYYLSVQDATNNLIQLVEAVDEKPSLVKRYLQNGGWLAGQLENVITEMFAKKVMRRDPPVGYVKMSEVSLVIFADWMDKEESLLRVVLPKLFPQAGVRKVDTHSSYSRPQGVSWNSPKQSDAPLCMNCGTKMRPAGSAFVCEGCGATSGFSTRVAQDNDILCEGCSYPMEEVVDRRRLGSRTYHCNRCGHEQSI
jgi:hypothetical protein